MLKLFSTQQSTNACRSFLDLPKVPITQKRSNNCLPISHLSVWLTICASMPYELHPLELQKTVTKTPH
jgi:hypothetical protein